MKLWLLGLCCLVLSSAALAAGPSAVRKSVQASMLVTGTIDVAPDGSVARYALDHPEKLSPQVIGLLDKTLSVWKFEPVVEDGKPVAAKALMGVRIVAKPLEDGNYSISIAGAWFGNGTKGEKDVSQDTITYKRRVQPTYPHDAERARVAGTVYVLEKVNRDGTVGDAVAEQVDLRVIASNGQLEAWRRVLADAALRALKQETFNPPTSGKAVDQPYWLARIPVIFDLSGPSTPAAVAPERYGQWQPYVPGPVQEPAWADKNQLAGSADALPQGGSLLANTSLHLRTPLDGS